MLWYFQTPQTSTSALPQAVSEVLRTAKGTAFYVLTVAGEHGISESENKEAESSTDAATTQQTGTAREFRNLDTKSEYIVYSDSNTVFLW